MQYSATDPRNRAVIEMLERTALRFLNHVLGAEPWGLARLKSFAGKRARFDIGPLSFSFAVSVNGALQSCDTVAKPGVTVHLPDDVLVRLLADRQSIFRSARIEGSADFAEALGFVAKNLRWDAEADVARVIGDIPARRISRDLAASLLAKRDAAGRFVANLTEFIVDEEALVMRPDALASFAHDIGCLCKDLDHLEARLNRL